MKNFLSVKDVLKELKKRWRIIIITCLFTTIIGAAYSFFYVVPLYRTTTMVFIGKDSADQKDYNSGDITMYQGLLKTYTDLLKTDDLIENALKKNNLGSNISEVLGGLKITPNDNTQILTLQYSSKDKFRGKEILDSVIDEFMYESKDLIPNSHAKIIKKSRVAKYPYNLNTNLNLLIAFAGGMVLGAAVALITMLMDKTLKTKEEIEECIGLSVIGDIPYKKN